MTNLIEFQRVGHLCENTNKAKVFVDTVGSVLIVLLYIHGIRHQRKFNDVTSRDL